MLLNLRQGKIYKLKILNRICKKEVNMNSLKNKIMPYTLATGIVVYSIGYSPAVTNSYGFGEEIGEMVIEKGSEKIRDNIKNPKTRENYGKFHKFMFDTFGLKEHNRKIRENQKPKKRRGITGIIRRQKK